MNWKAHLDCNFNCLTANEGLLKVMGGHVHVHFACDSSNISETVPDRVFVTTDH